MKIFKQLFLVTFLAVVLSGCLGVARVAPEVDKAAKEIIPPEGKALVYLIRPSIIGSAIVMKVECNQVYIGSTGAKRYLYVILDPGEYEFVSKAENLSRLIISVEAGKTYYIHQKVLIGALYARSRLVQLDDIAGRKKLNKCALSVDCQPEALQ